MRRLSFLLLACVLAPGCFTLDADGDGLIDTPPRAGDEINDLTCSDGRDNDYDGRIDCQDTDCLARGFCGEQIPLVPRFEPEVTPVLCTDGVDNDEDGQFDCGDRGCQQIMELCCNAETNDLTCSNRIDEDGNGFADCTDFSCRNNGFVSVCQSELQCIKWDAEGRRVACSPIEEAAAVARQCTDRFDNDGDRRTDCNDDDCSCEEVCYPGCRGPENTVERCLDGEDNDDNGFADCGDRACYDARQSPATGVAATECAARAENTAERCQDRADNDNNGYTDCRDRACAAFCGGGGGQPEIGVQACSDGMDNDGNGYVDCDDNSCRQSADIAVRTACEATPLSCHDHRDNNENGFTDCADFSCRFYECDFNLTGCTVDSECPVGQSCYQGGCLRVTSPCIEGAFLDSAFAELDGCPLRDELDPTDPNFEDELLERVIGWRAQVRAGCTDELDNDQDGFTDCDDWDCNHNPLAVHEDGVTPLCRGGDGRPLVCR